MTQGSKEGQIVCFRGKKICLITYLYNAVIAVDPDISSLSVSSLRMASSHSRKPCKRRDFLHDFVCCELPPAGSSCFKARIISQSYCKSGIFFFCQNALFGEIFCSLTEKTLLNIANDNRSQLTFHKLKIRVKIG